MLVSCSLRIQANDKHGFNASQFLKKYKDSPCRLDRPSLSCIFPSFGFSEALFKTKIKSSVFKCLWNTTLLHDSGRLSGTIRLMTVRIPYFWWWQSGIVLKTVLFGYCFASKNFVEIILLRIALGFPVNIHCCHGWEKLVKKLERATSPLKMQVLF